MENELVVINSELAIPLSELRFRFARSSGPGGQHVNTSATQVELFFDVAASPSLNDAQREHILGKLGTRIDAEGVLHIVVSRSRSQYQNRQEAIARLQALLRGALRTRKRRRPTVPSLAARQRRLASKRRRSEIKRLRSRLEREE